MFKYKSLITDLVNSHKFKSRFISCLFFLFFFFFFFLHKMTYLSSLLKPAYARSFPTTLLREDKTNTEIDHIWFRGFFFLFSEKILQKKSNYSKLQKNTTTETTQKLEHHICFLHPTVCQITLGSVQVRPFKLFQRWF